MSSCCFPLGRLPLSWKQLTFAQASSWIQSSSVCRGFLPASAWWWWLGARLSCPPEVLACLLWRRSAHSVHFQSKSSEFFYNQKLHFSCQSEISDASFTKTEIIKICLVFNKLVDMTRWRANSVVVNNINRWQQTDEDRIYMASHPNFKIFPRNLKVIVTIKASVFTYNCTVSQVVPLSVLISLLHC